MTKHKQLRPMRYDKFLGKPMSSRVGRTFVFPDMATYVATDINGSRCTIHINPVLDYDMLAILKELYAGVDFGLIVYATNPLLKSIKKDVV